MLDVPPPPLPAKPITPRASQLGGVPPFFTVGQRKRDGNPLHKTRNGTCHHETTLGVFPPIHQFAHLGGSPSSLFLLLLLLLLLLFLLLLLLWRRQNMVKTVHKAHMMINTKMTACLQKVTVHTSNQAATDMMLMKTEAMVVPRTATKICLSPICCAFLAH